MSFTGIHWEMRQHIGNFIQPLAITEQDVKSCGRIFVDLSLINKECKFNFSDQLARLKNIHLFITTFDKCNDIYEYLFKVSLPGDISHPGGNPQLLDIVSSGSNYSTLFVCSSQEHFTPELEQVIPILLELTPESLRCNLGSIRCRTKITPLSMACLNEKVPVPVIELLLKKGVHPNEATYRFNGEPGLHVLLDMKYMIKEKPHSEEWKERVKAIEALFVQYGVDPKYTK